MKKTFAMLLFLFQAAPAQAPGPTVPIEQPVTWNDVKLDYADCMATLNGKQKFIATLVDTIAARDKEIQSLKQQIDDLKKPKP